MLINLLIKPFYVFVIEVGVQNEVGPTEYGVFFSLFNFCYLFQFITDLGISNYNNISVATDPSFISKNIKKLLGVRIILAVLFFAFIGLFAFLIDYPETYYPMLWLIALNQILISFILYFRTNISGLGFYKTDSMISVLDKLLLICLVGYLLWFNIANGFEFSIITFVHCQMVSLMVTLITVIVVLFSKSSITSFTLKPSFDFSVIKKSLPYALIVLVMSAYSRIDGVMLERMLDDGGQEAGIYAASYRFLDALNILGFLFAGLLLPMFAKLISTNKSIKSVLLLSFKLINAIAISIALYINYNGDQLMQFLYPLYANDYYSNILILLTWGFLGIATTHIFGTLLTANQSLRRMNIILILGLVINVLLNWYFIPTYKAQAAATTTLITEVVVALGLILIVKSEFKLQIKIKPILSLAAYGLALFAFYHTLSVVINLDWIISLILGIIVSFVVSLLLHIIDIRVLKEVLFTR